MGKKRTRRVIEAIQYRPGERLGQLIEGFAETWKISRGKAAKRLAALAAHELDVSFAPAVGELAGYLDGKECFEEACHMVCSQLHDKRSTHLSEHVPRSEQLRHVQNTVEGFGRLCALEKEAEAKRSLVKSIRPR